jgi:hypothetical protein
MNKHPGIVAPDGSFFGGTGIAEVKAVLVFYLISVSRFNHWLLRYFPCESRLAVACF